MALLTRLGVAWAASGRRRAAGWLPLCLLLAWPSGAFAQSREYQIKAAFIYNFAQFAEWPESAFSSTNAPLVIGILGSNPFGTLLDELVKEEFIRGRPVEVRRLNVAEEMAQAHLVYISRSEESQWNGIRREASGHPVLTVSDINNFARRGGMIHMETEGNRVRLKIHQGNAREAGLVLSSKLLRVAEVVDAE